MTILDHRGNPISSRMLLRPHVDEDSMFTSPERTPRANGLTPEKLGRLFRAADEGDVEAFMTLAEEIEERDLHYRGVLGARKMVLSQLIPEVEAVDDSDEQQEIAAAVKEVVEAPEFCELLFHAADGIAKGYSLVEILWEATADRWYPRGYKWRDPRWYRVDPVNLTGLRLEDGSAEGAPLPPNKYVVFVPLQKSGIPLRNGLARLVAGAYLCKSYTVKDLMRFLESYGIPTRIAHYGTAGSDAGRDSRKKLIAAMHRLQAHGWAIFPEDIKVDTLAGQKGSEAGAFLGTAEFWDRQTSKVVLGQTSSADGTAGNYKAADQHKGVRLDIQKHDARTLIAAVVKQLIRPFVAFNFGPQERYPRVTLPVPDHQDIAKFATAVTMFVDRGLKVDQAQILERMGLAKARDDAELLRPSTQHDLDGTNENGPPSEESEPSEGERSSEDA